MGLRARRATVFAGYRFSACTHRLVSSVGRAPVSRAGGRGFRPRLDQPSGSLMVKNISINNETAKRKAISSLLG